MSTMHVKEYSVKCASFLEFIHINEAHTVICSNDSDVTFLQCIILIFADIPPKRQASQMSISPEKYKHFTLFLPS